MGLRIQNNIAALNAHKNLQISDAGLSKSLERLSSGYRINRAADDAAGLAISQSLRADIASFKVASRNTSEAGSLLQVAEGAMDQIGNMLTRLKELATQAASANAGTNLDKLNAEKTQLINEINRIANVTEYAGTTLIDGTFGTASATWDTTGEIAMDTVNGNKVTYSDTGSNHPTITFSFSSAPTDLSGTFTLATASGGNMEMTSGGQTFLGTVSGNTVTFDSIGLTLNAASTLVTANMVGDTIAFEDTKYSSLTLDDSATAGTLTITADAANNTLTLSDGTTSQSVVYAPGSASAQALSFDQLGATLNLAAGFDDTEAGYLNSMTMTVTASGSSVFQVGANNSSNDQISISLGNATTGASGLNIADLDLSSATGAQAALTTIDAAIDTLTSTRGDIGAYQNRLAYAAANLSTTIENVSAAESVIRDVDMAAEMTTFTKNQILMQAGTAMLAQANMAPQSILSLLG